MAGHLAAQEAVWAGAAHSPPAHAVLPLPLLSGASGGGLQGGWRGPCPVPDFWASSGAPGVCWACLWPQDPAWAGWCRGQEKCDQGDQGQVGSEDGAGAGPVPLPSTHTAPPATSYPGGRGQAADCSCPRSSQTRGCR